MAKLNHYEFADLPSFPEQGTEAFVYLLDETDQWMFEAVRFDVVDKGAEKAARLGGRAILSSMEFTGMMSLVAGDGKLTLRQQEIDEK